MNARRKNQLEHIKHPLADVLKSFVLKFDERADLKPIEVKTVRQARNIIKIIEGDKIRKY